MATVETTAAASRRVALLGLNARAERLLIPGLLAAGNCTLTALCSRSAEQAAAVAARHGVPHRFGSVAALLASGVADTIFINTPPAAHRAAAVAARSGWRRVQATYAATVAAWSSRGNQSLIA